MFTLSDYNVNIRAKFSCSYITENHIHTSTKLRPRWGSPNSEP